MERATRPHAGENYNRSNLVWQDELSTQIHLLNSSVPLSMVFCGTKEVIATVEAARKEVKTRGKGQEERNKVNHVFFPQE
jgi:hypothetical protein